MEQKSSRERAADQLQSPAVQDQAVQSQSGRPATPDERIEENDEISRVENGSYEPETVVLQCNQRTVKGILEWPHWNSREEFSCVEHAELPSTFRIRQRPSGIVEEVPSSSIKAVFFVKNLGGGAEHNNLQFHAHAPVVPGIWMRVKFRDGEVIEGVARNSIHYLTEPGFFLRPIDPDSNNHLIYVLKASLQEHYVLGLTRI